MANTAPCRVQITVPSSYFIRKKSHNLPPTPPLLLNELTITTQPHQPPPSLKGHLKTTMLTRYRTTLAFIICISLLLLMFFHTHYQAYRFAHFELGFFYDHERLIRFIDHLGDNGRRFYLHQHLPLHAAFWLAFATAYHGLFRRQTARAWPSLWPYTAALPLFASTFALLETVVIALNISQLAPNSLMLAVPAHICSLLWLLATHIILLSLKIIEWRRPARPDETEN